MKFKFKLIPFLLSLLIVFGVTFGICWYSYHEYPLNKYAFYEEYFHLDDYENYETTELIENAVKFQFNGYKKASSTIQLVETSNTETPSYKDGTISVPGYFDIDVYITESVSEGESTYNYYFYFYNVNYKNSTFEPSERIQIVVVEGSGEGTSENEDDELYGNALLDQELEELYDDDENNNPKYNGLYPYSWNTESHYYPVFDNGHSNDEKNTEVTEHYVYRSAPRESHLKQEIFNDKIPEDGTATFAIIAKNNDGDDYKELVRGTFSEINKLNEVEFKEGCAGDAYKADYFDVVGSKVFLHGAIAFGISAVIAILFYMLWLDPKQSSKKQPTKNQKQNKNKK